MGHLNLSKVITLFTATGETSIKRVDCEETALFKFPMSNILYLGEVFGLEEGRKIVKVAGDVFDWASSKLWSTNHSPI